MANEKLPQTLISLLFLLMVANMALSQTISFQIDSFGPDPKDLTYEGDAFVPSGTSFLRLTKTDDSSGNPLPSRSGRVLYTGQTIPAWGPGKKLDLETTIKFKITAAADGNPADGIAFFMSPVGSPQGTNGGNFGIFNQSGLADSVFAVEIDVYRNEWDPDCRHIGIDINSHKSENTGCLDDSFLGKEVSARINYEGATQVVTAYVHIEGGPVFGTISHQVVFSDILPQDVQVGIGASTGAYFALQDIYSWYFTATMINKGNVDDEGIRQVVST